jgi:EmrB/QacA subfamily drug resistance transporter
MAQAQGTTDIADSPSVVMDQRARLFVVGAVMMGLFLAALDQTVVGTALPRIVTDLHGNTLYTWVVTAYLLSSTITVPIYGKFSDVYGRKVMLLVGIGIFLAGSVLSGLSQDMTQLIIFRGLQGLGAGALFPISLAVIGDLFTPRERGRYQGLFGAVFGLSFIVGPFVGGWITDNISWHWVFYVNIPVGLAALVIIALVLPNFHPPIKTSARDLDYAGIAVFSAAIIPILLGLTNKVASSGQVLAWTDPSVGGLILIGAVLMMVFLAIEGKAKQPIIPLHLFRSRTYSASNVAVFMVMFGMYASIIFLPRFYQAVHGYSATDSGYQIWPLLVGLIGSSIASGFAISRIGKYKLILVGSVMVFIVGGFLMTHLTATTSNEYLWFWMFLMGLGIGPAMSGFTVVVQNAVAKSELGVATSTLTFLRQIGGSVGLAISGTLFSQEFSAQLPRSLAQHIPKLARQQVEAVLHRSGQSSITGVNLGAVLARVAPPDLRQWVPATVRAIHNAFSLAVGQVFWLTFWSALLALVATLLVREIPLRGPVTVAGEAAAGVPGSEVSCESPLKEAVPAQ